MDHLALIQDLLINQHFITNYQLTKVVLAGGGHGILIIDTRVSSYPPVHIPIIHRQKHEHTHDGHHNMANVMVGSW